jgi:hypothetical protein
MTRIPPGARRSNKSFGAADVVAEIDPIEADTQGQVEHTTLDRQGQVCTLGRLLLFAFF